MIVNSPIVRTCSSSPGSLAKGGETRKRYAPRQSCFPAVDLSSSAAAGRADTRVAAPVFYSVYHHLTLVDSWFVWNIICIRQNLEQQFYWWKKIGLGLTRTPDSHVRRSRSQTTMATAPRDQIDRPIATRWLVMVSYQAAVQEGGPPVDGDNARTPPTIRELRPRPSQIKAVVSTRAIRGGRRKGRKKRGMKAALDKHPRGVALAVGNWQHVWVATDEAHSSY
jgi:hypothetical protein